MAQVEDYSALVVRVKNGQDTDYVDGFDGRRYVIPAGAESVVPIDAAKLWFGNWDSRNKDAMLRERDDEVARLKVRWGVYDNPLPAPPLSVFTLMGEAITTVMEDPKGEGMEPIASGDEEKLRLAGMMAQYQRQLAALQEQMVKVSGGTPALEDILEDEGDEGVAPPPLPEDQLDVPDIPGERVNVATKRSVGRGRKPRR